MGKFNPWAALLWTGLLLMGSCAGGSSTAMENSPARGRVLIQKPALPKAAAGYSDPIPDFTRDLVDSAGSRVGSLRVVNDASSLRLHFSLEGAAAITSAYAYYGAEAPAADADPAAFPSQAGFAEPVSTCQLQAELGAVTAGDTLQLSACVSDGTHFYWASGQSSGAGLVEPQPAPALAEMSVAPASVNPAVMTNVDFTPPQVATGLDWGGDNLGTPSFGYIVQPVFSPVTQWQSYVASGNYGWGTWGVSFLESGWLPFEEHATFTGWCIDRAHSMYSGQPYEVQLYSCYDPALPEFAQSDNYDLLSYLITQRNTNHQYPWNENWGTLAGRIAFQDAVWYFMGGGGMPGEGSLGYRIVQDALAHGEGFVPGPGQYYAAILFPHTETNDPDLRAQENVIEVEVPAPVF